MRFTRRLFGVRWRLPLRSRPASSSRRPNRPPPSPPPSRCRAEVVKIVRIDALSGLLGPVGVNQLKGYQYFAEKFSATNPAA